MPWLVRLASEWGQTPGIRSPLVVPCVVPLSSIIWDYLNTLGYSFVHSSGLESLLVRSRCSGVMFLFQMPIGDEYWRVSTSPTQIMKKKKARESPAPSEIYPFFLSRYRHLWIKSFVRGPFKWTDGTAGTSPCAGGTSGNSGFGVTFDGLSSSSKMPSLACSP